MKNFNKVPAFQRGMEIWTEEIVRNPDVGGYLQQLFLGQVRTLAFAGFPALPSAAAMMHAALICILQPACILLDFELEQTPGHCMADVTRHCACRSSGSGQGTPWTGQCC